MTDQQAETSTIPEQAPPAEPPQKKKGGPCTAEGKRRSSLNATRHQLLSKTYIATPEESQAFGAHMTAYREAIAPVGFLESELATLIAMDRWKIERAISIENSIFASGYLDHAEAIDVDNSQVAEALAESKTWTPEAHSLSLLNTYEGRIGRRADKNITQLTAMQTHRKGKYTQAQQEAIHLVELAEAQNAVYDPGDDFQPASAWIETSGRCSLCLGTGVAPRAGRVD